MVLERQRLYSLICSLKVLIDFFSTCQLIHSTLTIEPLLLLILPFLIEYAYFEMITPLTFADALFAIRTFLHRKLWFFDLHCFPDKIWFKLKIWVQSKCGLGNDCCVWVWHWFELLVFQNSNLDIVLFLNGGLPVLSWFIDLGFHCHIIIQINLLNNHELVPIKTACIWNCIIFIVFPFFRCPCILDAPFIVHLPLATCLQHVHLAFSKLSVSF